MHLIEIIKNQAALSYTGRVNFLSASDKQYRGHLCMVEGDLCYAQFDGECGLEPLFCVIAQDFYLSSLSFVCEPETIDREYNLFRKSARDIVNESREYYRLYLYAHKNPPPDHLRLTIDVDYLFRASTLNAIEFNLLAIVARYNRVFDIVNHSKLSKIRCVMALVSLREKKILRVLKEVRNEVSKA